jgi:cytoplasmic iron level regulating protein YaaA (DUF328/UPF0246 family)
MLILTSPAKTLDFSSEYQVPLYSQPHFLKEATELISLLKKCSKKELQDLMNVSSDIAQVNYDRFKAWDPKHNLENSRPAIVAYAGQIYQQIHEKEFSEQQAMYLQDSLRILSGLYGVVRPYDLIQPYRLEMNATLKNPVGSNLYTFWGDKLTHSLNYDIDKHELDVVVDLASEEYDHGIDPKKLHAPLLRVVFNQRKGDEVLNLGLLAKKARGMMIDFMAKNRIYDVAQLETFSGDGYSFTSKTATSLLFTKEGTNLK